MKLFWGISLRVMVAAVVPTLLMGVLLTVLLTTLRINDLEQSLLQRGRAIARQLAAGTVYGLFSGDRDALTQQAKSALEDGDLRAVMIYDRDGQLVAHQGNPLRAQEDPHQLVRLSETVRTSPITSTSEDDAYGLAPAEGTSETLGRVEVLISLDTLSERKRSLAFTALSTTALILAISAALAGWMSRSVSKPIRQAARSVAAIGRGELRTRLPVEGGGSLRLLATGVNEMAARLETAREDLEYRIDEATRQLREKKDEAERANLAKSRFLAAASHDLRQPMHAIGLFVADLLRQTHPPATRALVERVAVSAEAMENLLNALLDISRLDAGVLEPRRQPVALEPIFERLGAEMAESAREKGLVLKVRPTQLWVDTDPMLFERIVQNLLGNALRYTQNGRVMLAARARREWVRVEVRDSGIGIPQQAQEQIFQEFVQLDNAARDRSKGLGLGLAIVRRISLLLGHRLSLRSRPGAGSVFAVELPRAAAAPILSPGPESVPQLDQRLIAMVDDDVLARESLAGLLRGWGCRVVAAESCGALLAELERLGLQPEALISDYRLPDEDGLAVIVRVREHFGAALPAMLLSGDTDANVLRTAADRGIPMLHKPVRPNALRKSLRGLLEQHEPRV